MTTLREKNIPAQYRRSTELVFLFVLSVWSSKATKATSITATSRSAWKFDCPLTAPYLRLVYTDCARPFQWDRWSRNKCRKSCFLITKHLTSQTYFCTCRNRLLYCHENPFSSKYSFDRKESNNSDDSFSIDMNAAHAILKVGTQRKCLKSHSKHINDAI